MYEGDWFQNQKHGIGAYYYQDGNVYFGGWKHNKKEGKGIYKHKSEKKWQRAIFQNDEIKENRGFN